MTVSRQVSRAAARKNDYWVPGPRSNMVPARSRGCRRLSATNRDHVSVRVIAAKQPRERTSPRPQHTLPIHMRHAWQRKAYHAAELRKVLGQ